MRVFTVLSTNSCAICFVSIYLLPAIIFLEFVPLSPLFIIVLFQLHAHISFESFLVWFFIFYFFSYLYVMFIPHLLTVLYKLTNANAISVFSIDMIYSIIFGHERWQLIGSVAFKCSNEILSVASMLSVPNCFLRPNDARRAADEAKSRYNDYQCRFEGITSIYFERKPQSKASR